MSEIKHHRVYIIGSGPAGYTAGLYAARAGLEPYMAAGIQPGGQLTTTTEVENYPGFPEGIMGPEMMVLFEQQATRFGLTVEHKMVEKVDVEQHPFRIWEDDGEAHTADTVIIATGATAKYLGVPGEQEYLGRGVSACATCDGFFFRDQEIVVVGGGDTAMEEASFLTRFATKVYVVHRCDELRAISRTAERRGTSWPMSVVMRERNEVAFFSVVGRGRTPRVICLSVIPNATPTLRYSTRPLFSLTGVTCMTCAALW